MDVETFEAIESLRDELGQVETRLSVQIVRSEASTKSELGAEMAQMRTELRGEMAAMGNELRGEMRAMRDDLRGEIAESRTHAQVLNESVRDDIRLLAEAVAVLSVKVDALHH